MAGRVFTRSAKDPEFQSRSSHNYSLATNGSQYKKLTVERWVSLYTL